MRKLFFLLLFILAAVGGASARHVSSCLLVATAKNPSQP